MPETLEKIAPPVEEIMTPEMRVKENIRIDLETKKTSLDIKKYLPHLFEGIIEPNPAGNYPDLDWNNIEEIDQVLDRLYEDWDFVKSKVEYLEEKGVKEQIRGLLIEWLILRSINEFTGRKNQDIFEFYKPGGEYADAVLNTDMTARFKIGPEWKSIRLDITTSPKRREDKYEGYQRVLREKGPKMASLPVLFPQHPQMREKVILEKTLEVVKEDPEQRKNLIFDSFLRDLGLLLLQEIGHGNLAWDSKKLVEIFKKLHELG